MAEGECAASLLHIEDFCNSQLKAMAEMRKSGVMTDVMLTAGSGGGEGGALRGLGLCLSRSAKLAKQPPARSRSTHRAQFEKTAGGRRTRLRCCGGGVRWPGVKKWKQASL